MKILSFVWLLGPAVVSALGSPIHARGLAHPQLSSWMIPRLNQPIRFSLPRPTASSSLRQIQRQSIALEAATAAGAENLATPSEAPTTVRPPWVPSWLCTMSVPTQVFVGLLFYSFHTLVLTQHLLPFPVQIIPNESGLFQSIGLDSLAGLLVSIGAVVWRPWRFHPKSPPWRVSRGIKGKVAGVGVTLVVLHYLSSYVYLACEWLLYGLVLAGLPISIAMERSLQVLGSHLAWVLVGARVLGQSFSFFGNASKTDEKNTRKKKEETSNEAKVKKEKSIAQGSEADATESAAVASSQEQGGAQPLPPLASVKDHWLSMRFRTNWLWWVVGGYFASCWVFNCADVLNQFILPDEIFTEAAESVVTQMINPENNDLWAMAVASLAPCVSAPWWEEVLYRGFLLPALHLFFPLPFALPLSGLLFGLHHQAIASVLPLAALGSFWALLYVLSRNLAVPVLIHALWNSRVFLGSLLGV